MKTESILLLLGLVFLTGVVSYCFFMIRERLDNDRKDKLYYQARKLNLAFVPFERIETLKNILHFPLFMEGTGRSLKNVIRGRVGHIQVVIFDYQYIEASGGNTHSRSQTVILCESKQLQLPSFSLRPVTYLDKIFEGFVRLYGLKNEEFRSAPGFAKLYMVDIQDKTQLDAVFTNEVLSYYEHYGQTYRWHGKLRTQAEGQHLIFYQEAKKISPEEIRVFLESGIELCHILES